MKLIPFVLRIVLVLMLTVPKDSEGLFAVSLALIIARTLGMKLVKNMNYVRCETVNDPPGLRCPNKVYGAGLTRDQAISAAKLFSKRGDAGKECENYVSKCKVLKFRGKWRPKNNIWSEIKEIRTKNNPRLECDFCNIIFLIPREI